MILLLLHFVPAAAQETKAWRPPFEIEVIDLHLSGNGVAYRLFLRKPLVEPRPGEKPIAVYVLDALWDLPAVAASQSNSEFLGHYPAIYYVGLGYRNENEGVRREENRTRDYTPTAWAPPDPQKHFLSPIAYQGSGGAAAFVEVLEKQIFPFVESRYDVDPASRGLVGKSMGGLLATYVLLSRSSLFTHYLIISPALWWDDYFTDFRDRAVMRLENSTRTAKLEKPTRVWIGMGDGEEKLGMLADVYVLGRALRLRADPALDLAIEIPRRVARIDLLCGVCPRHPQALPAIE